MKITKPCSLVSRYRVLEMVTADDSETTVLIYHNTRHHKAEESIFVHDVVTKPNRCSGVSEYLFCKGDYSPLMERIRLCCKLNRSQTMHVHSNTKLLRLFRVRGGTEQIF